MNLEMYFRSRTRLPGTSKTPLWLLVLSVNLVLCGGYGAALYLEPQMEFYYHLVALFIIMMINVGLVQVIVSVRIGGLAVMLQQDPLVIVGDPQCVEKLAYIPWWGVSEVDALQLAIYQTYNAYALDSRRAGANNARVSHADDYSDVEWRTANSEDDQISTLNEYLLSQQQRRPGSRLKRLFGRSSKASAPSVYSCQSGDGDDALPNERSNLIHNARGPQGSPPSQPHPSGKTAQSDEVRLPIAEHVRCDSNASSGCSIGVIPDTPPSFDPLNDNHSSWDIVKRGVKDPGGSLLIQLLSQVRVGQPLSAVTLPVHILECRSLLERISDMCVHWQFLTPISSGAVADPIQKMICVFKWFIAAYRMRPIGARKPYNPILGEVFHAVFPPIGCDGRDTVTKQAGGSTTMDNMEFIAEQVSHHPPISAFSAWFGADISLVGLYHPKSKLVSLNCAASLAEGGFTIQFSKTGDAYKISWPSFFATGIVSGDPRLELGGTVKIQDTKTGVEARVEFLRKGWLGGEFDKMECRIFDSAGRPSAHQFAGTWFDVIHELPSNRPFHDPTSVAHLAPRPQAVDTPQHPKQSRAIWKELTVALRSGDCSSAAAAKLKVENAQRAERKQMSTDGKEHVPVFFRFQPNGSQYGSDPAAKAAIAFKAASSEDKFNPSNWVFIGGEGLKLP